MLEAAEPPDSLATARARSDFAQVLFWKGQAEAGDATSAASTRRTGASSAPTTRRPPCTCATWACSSTRSTGSTRRRRPTGNPRRSSSARSGPDHVNLGYSYSISRPCSTCAAARPAEAEELYRRTLDDPPQGARQRPPDGGPGAPADRALLPEPGPARRVGGGVRRGAGALPRNRSETLRGRQVPERPRPRRVAPRPLCVEAEKRLDEVDRALRRVARAEASVLVAGAGQPGGADRTAGTAGGSRGDPARGPRAPRGDHGEGEQRDGAGARPARRRAQAAGGRRRGDPALPAGARDPDEDPRPRAPRRRARDFPARRPWPPRPSRTRGARRPRSSPARPRSTASSSPDTGSLPEVARAQKTLAATLRTP